MSEQVFKIITLIDHNEVFIQKIREVENVVLELLKTAPPGSDGRWLSIAKTHFQEGRMAAVRSITD